MKKYLFLFFQVIVFNMIFLSIGFAQSDKKEQERLMPTVYYMVFLEIGEKWKNSEVSILRDPTLANIWMDHGQYMDEMNGKGVLVLGGPFLDNLEKFLQSMAIDGGMLLYKTATLQETEELVRNDPIIQSGAYVVKDIKPFLIFVGGDKPLTR